VELLVPMGVCIDIDYAVARRVPTPIRGIEIIFKYGYYVHIGPRPAKYQRRALVRYENYMSVHASN
jgi:hypothetical protein